MKSTWLFVFVASLIAIQAFKPRDYQKWKDFKAKYRDGRSYRSLHEETKRMEIFLSNDKMIAEHNEKYKLGKKSFRMGMNHFGDLSSKEFMQIYSTKINMDEIPRSSSRRTNTLLRARSTKLPKSIDWRKEGVVTPVKDQRQCGSYWAFSTVGAIESHLAIKTGILKNYSEQQLLDCTVGTEGCKGGWPHAAFDYVASNGINLENDYPYEGKQEDCRYNQTKEKAHIDVIDGFTILKEGDEEILKKAVAFRGPVVIAVSVTHNFRFYEEGVFDGDDCRIEKEPNHAALAVGYGSDEGRDYWIVKYSWGEDWGEKGYMKMARNKNNTCFVASFATLPSFMDKSK